MLQRTKSNLEKEIFGEPYKSTTNKFLIGCSESALLASAVTQFRHACAKCDACEVPPREKVD